MVWGYVFLLVAVLAGAIKGFCGKKTSAIIKTTSNIALLSFIRMVLCTVIAFFVVLITSGGFNGFVLDGNSLLICVISAIGNSFFLITWTICVKKSSLSLISVFSVLSTLFPILIARFVWEEKIAVFKMVGFGLLLISTVIMWLYNNKIKGKFTFLDIILLILYAIFNGAIFLSEKWIKYSCPDFSAQSFTFYTYLFSLLIILIFFIITRSSEKSHEKFEFKKIFILLIILAICLFLNTFFNVKAAELLDAAVKYPLATGLGLILSMLMGHFFFKERTNKISIIGIVIAITSFILMVLPYGGSI